MADHDEITKIESLTPEQEAQFPGWVEKWTIIGLSTEPADRPKAMTAVRGLYRQSSLEQVPIGWVSSPIVGALAASLLSVIVPGIRKILTALDEQFGLGEFPKVDYSAPELLKLDELASEKFGQPRPRTLENVSDDWVACDDIHVVHAVDVIANAIMQAEYLPRLNAIAKKAPEQANVAAVAATLEIAALMRDTMMKEQLEWHAWYGGQFWCAFAAWATFFRDVLHVKVPQIEHEANLCESAGYIWPNEGFCLICERPRRLTVVNDRLDDAEGPAMEYPDGWQLWFIGGVRVTKQIVMEPEKLTLQQIMEEQSEEVRRIMINRWGGRDAQGEMRPNIEGWTRFINEAGAEQLDKRDNEIENTEELLVKTPGNMVLFISHCPSTGRHYSLEIPSDLSPMTCEQAQRSLQSGNSLTQSQPDAMRIVGRS